ncbi:MAG: ABC transporter ATP-binding protein [Anaerolineales bacterium]
MSDKPVVLEIKDLKTEFHTQDGVVHAVNGIGYSLREGDTLGIVGESGCGKSVSMLSVMRLLQVPPAKIAAGYVKFRGKDIFSLADEEMRDSRGSQMAMLFQDPMTSLNPVLTIGFQLMEPLQVHMGMTEQEARVRAAELLKLVGIPEAENRLEDYPHQFSGGMRQRVMIAMALACNPALLIADEPTTALDVTIQAQIVELVNRLQEHFGMTLIWITHDLGVTARLVNRIIVMYAGFIVEDAPVEELYTNPRHPYTKALLKSLPRLDGRRDEKLQVIEGLPPDLSAMPKGCPFAPRCEYVKDYCWEHNPPLLDEGPNHTAACWVNLDTRELKPEAKQQ